MYPTLPFGPLSLPTGPILTLVAVMVGLDVAGRYGRKLGLNPDEIWNTGLIAFASGLIVARLWNVFQFTSIYRSEPNLIVSLRPSGFALWPGVAAGLIAGFAYLVYRAMDPGKVGGAMAIGTLVGGAVLSVAGYLTGSILGLPSALPWALNYFGVPRHPAGLYLAFGMAALAVLLWYRANPARPGQTILGAILGYSLLRLFVDGFRDGMEMAGSFRISQVLALTVALVCIVLLARGSNSLGAQTPEHTPSARPDDATQAS
jgi:phosphatidylglycerol:prolipoprotein diacylglycerol transferase